MSASENRDLQRGLTSDATHALVIGNQVFVSALTADGKPFVFSRKQMEFFLALQRLKVVQPAALAINETEEWANRFLASKKFKAFVAAKMQEISIKQGVTIEWWYQFGKKLAEGYELSYYAFCCQQSYHFTEYEIESQRQDDMTLNVLCAVCQQPMAIEEKENEFKPTREQVEGWKEFGSRLIPKIERVQHEFEKTEMVFETGQ